jgi:hypothetical protein
MLPRTLNPSAKKPNKFQEKYGKKSQDLIKKLLKQAQQKTDDQNIKKEIEKRLKILKPKTKKILNCKVCNKEFEAKRYRYGTQKICLECKAKIYSTQTTS